MTNEELNTALYEKMFESQKKYRAWILSQPAEAALNHAYEYFNREDILLSLEYNDLSSQQARALLKSHDPLADIFKDWEMRETNHMENIWETIQARANAAILAQKRAEHAR